MTRRILYAIGLALAFAALVYPVLYVMGAPA